MNHMSESNGSVPAFLAKLWRLVEDNSTNHLICWNADGKSFIIRNQAKFSQELLPLNYKHNNMASFIRQLNMYGFHKIASIDDGGLKFDRDEMEFSHAYFKRGHVHYLNKIKRKISTTKLSEDTTKSGKSEHVHTVLNEVKLMRGRQETLDTKFGTMKQENEALWREIAVLRQKHIKQQQIVNKLIQFLVTIVRPQRASSGINSMTGIKRCFPLMINDVPVSERIPTCQQTKDNKVFDDDDNDENSISSGPIIHELLEEVVYNPSEENGIGMVYDENIQNNTVNENVNTPDIQSTDYHHFEDCYESENNAPIEYNIDHPNIVDNNQDSQYIDIVENTGNDNGNTSITLNDDNIEYILYNINNYKDTNQDIPTTIMKDTNVTASPTKIQRIKTHNTNNNNDKRLKSLGKTKKKRSDNKKMQSVLNKYTNNKSTLSTPMKATTVTPSLLLKNKSKKQINHNENPIQSTTLNIDNIKLEYQPPATVTEPENKKCNSKEELIGSDLTYDFFDSIENLPLSSEKLNSDANAVASLLMDAKTLSFAPIQTIKSNVNFCENLIGGSANPTLSEDIRKNTPHTHKTALAISKYNTNQNMSNNNNNNTNDNNTNDIDGDNNNNNNTNKTRNKFEDVLRLNSPEELNQHLESVQQNLESLKEYFRAEDYPQDSNSLLNTLPEGSSNYLYLSPLVDPEMFSKLFGDFDELPPFEFNPNFQADKKSENDKNAAKGTEIISYQQTTPFNNFELSDLLSVNSSTKNNIDDNIEIDNDL